jgi:DAACS family dicarboxylate/amino acid:cation (Na+ or H+) symporter
MAQEKSEDEPSDAEDGAGGRSSLALHWKILIGLVVGATLGLMANRMFPSSSPGGERLEWMVKNVTQPIGQVFLRLIFMIVLPLVFSALVLGIAEIGDVKKLGRLGLRTLGFTLLLSGVSVVIGIGIVSLVQPGRQLSEASRERLREQVPTKETAEKVAKAKQAKPLHRMLLDIIPENPLQEAVGALDGSSPGGGMLAVMFFALMFGVAITLAPERTGPLVAVLQGIYDVAMVIIGFAMQLAPYGVAALIFSLAAALGLEILKTLAWYVGTVLAGLLIHLVIVYSVVVWLFGRLSPLRFFERISEALVTAFATSSSNATLPTALRVAENELSLKPHVAQFVLTIGSTANQNGTALYEGITVLFLAQVFGVELSLAQQITVVLMCILAGVGTAGVPGGSLPLVGMVLLSVGVQPEGIGIILGVDRLLDMCRTTLNVAGDLVVATCVNRGET